MKVIRAHHHGGPEVLQLDELPTPEPAAGEALVRVEAAGVNYIDTYHRSGLYPRPLPQALGLEGAGTVEAAGPGVSLERGTRVAWTGVPGSYATHVIAPADKLVMVPPDLPTAKAAAAMLQGMTAHYLTQTVFPLGRSHTCLVHAAAGGVGLLVCQMAARAGARVLGTASTDAKVVAAQAAGATDMIRYDEVDFAGEVKRLTSGSGVDVVYDGVGRTTFDGSLESLRVRGMMVLFGQASGPVPPVDLLVLSPRALFLTRPSLHHYTRTRAELEMRAQDVLAWIASGDLRLTIDRELPLEQAGRAHELLESRQTSGKLLLIP